MNLRTIVKNEIDQESSGVWVLRGHREFGYSDGQRSESYLERVLSEASDLSCASEELRRYIRDWSSEYHLTVARSQLFSGFKFDRSLKVLEVGCGCGAITRYLGETFDEVVSVEGSLQRARVARKRTRDLPGVSIICAPFQEISFDRSFDIIFCVGVLEYSASFVNAPNPYEAVLEYFSKLLGPNGTLIVAIENQFGLKYFGSAREDHLGVMFAGLEGYPEKPEKVRTFGRVELDEKLRKYFSSTEFYYPYPDYKLPSCVLSEAFLASPVAGELVSQMRSRDYAGETRPLWDEGLVALELSRNRILSFFANSFLVFAHKGERTGYSFDQLAVIFSAPDRGKLRARTRVTSDESGNLRVLKGPASGANKVEVGDLSLVETSSVWYDSFSLQTTVMLRAKTPAASLAEIFEPCKPWVSLLLEKSVDVNGVRYLEGDWIDCIWSNIYPTGATYSVSDREWVWRERVPLNAMVIRAIFTFLSQLDGSAKHAEVLRSASAGKLIRQIAEVIGVRLRAADFDAFVRLEAAFQGHAFGVNPGKKAFELRWYLRHRPSLRVARKVKHFGQRVLRSLLTRLG